MDKQRLMIIAAMIAAALCTNHARAQTVAHSDVFFTYGDTKIEIEPQDGRLAIPQVMPVSGFFAQANSNPGFFSERDIGGGTGPSDIVGYNVLSDLMFWTDGDFAQPKDDTAIRIINNPGSVEDTIIGTGTGEQPADFNPLTNSIGQSLSSGDFHVHVDFRLEPRSSDPEEQPLFGAYGLKLNLISDNPNIEESDPFFIVYEFGMDGDLFQQALNDFDELLSADAGLPGDFDADGLLTAADIDLLSTEVRAGTDAQSFDLTGDTAVDNLDRVEWVEELAGTHFGDADLDGNVQFSDFLSLSANFGQEAGWAGGDFDGDGSVQFSDFLTLSANFGSATAASQSVPEPHSSAMFVSLFALAGCFRRKR